MCKNEKRPSGHDELCGYHKYTSFICNGHFYRSTSHCSLFGCCKCLHRYTSLLEGRSVSFVNVRKYKNTKIIIQVWQIYVFTDESRVFLLLCSTLWSIGLISQFFLFTLQTVGLLGRVISSSQGLYLITGQHKHRINAYTHQTSMPCVGFELTMAVSERKKTVHASGRSATVTGEIQLDCVILITYAII
jgi:hypothetical protein